MLLVQSLSPPWRRTGGTQCIPTDAIWMVSRSQKRLPFSLSAWPPPFGWSSNRNSQVFVVAIMLTSRKEIPASIAGPPCRSEEGDGAPYPRRDAEHRDGAKGVTAPCPPCRREGRKGRAKRRRATAPRPPCRSEGRRGASGEEGPLLPAHLFKARRGRSAPREGPHAGKPKQKLSATHPW